MHTSRYSNLRPTSLVTAPTVLAASRRASPSCHRPHPSPPLPPCLNRCCAQSLLRRRTHPQVLKLGDACDQPLSPLPPALLILQTGRSFNCPLNSIPPTLQILKLGANFSQQLQPLPPALRELHVGEAFDCTLDVLPPTLRQLVLPYSYAHALMSMPRGPCVTWY
jgi:hypothetical protein